MPASLKNMLIGIFVLTAIAIIVFMLLFLHPTVGDNAKILHVRFTDIDKVNLGTRVTFAGRPVGEVISISEIPDARTSRLAKNGDVYVYELVLNVDSAVDVFNTDSITLRTSGLLGERNIEITPLPLKPGEKLKLVDNEIIYAEQTGSLEETMKQFKTLAQKVDLVLDDFHHTMEEIKQKQIVDKIAHTAQNVVEITDALNEPEKYKKIINNIFNLTDLINQSWPTVDSSLQNIHQLTDRALVSWNTIDQTLQEFHATGVNARELSQTANQIVQNTSQGHGTIGQLLVGNDLYLRLKSILHKGETTMDDINTYGILFHLDKRWQRLHARRLRLLEKLSSPEVFSQYFNHELDQISDSLSLVSLILNESECYPESLMINPEYTQRFADLLKRLENMDDSLKMYNEQVVNQECN